MGTFWTNITLHLSIDGVESPIKWGFNLEDASISLERTEEHGFIYTFPEKEVTLEFIKGQTIGGFEDGQKLIEDVIDNRGELADIRLIFKRDGIEFLNAEWDAATYKGGFNYGKKTNLAFKGDNWDDVFDRQRKIKAEINRDTDLENNPIIQLQPELISTHSKIIRKIFDAEQSEDEEKNKVIDSGVNNDSNSLEPNGGLRTQGGTAMYVINGFEKQNSGEFDNNFTYSTQATLVRNTDNVSNFISTSLRPTENIGGVAAPANTEFRPVEDSKLFHLKVNLDGDYTVNINTASKVIAKKVPVSGAVDLDNIVIINHFRVYDKDGKLKHDSRFGELSQLGVSVPVSTNDFTVPNPEFEVNGTLLQTYQLTKDDEVYVYTYWYIQHGETTQHLESEFSFTGTISIVGDTFISDTLVQMYKSFDFLEKLIEITTGNANALRSSILEGHYTNGTLIRNGKRISTEIEAVTKTSSPSTNLDDILESENMMNNIGVATELDGIQNIIRVEHVEYFYQNHEILSLVGRANAPVLWSFDNDRIFNTADFRYPDFRDDELNTIDEFNTNASYVLNSTIIDQAYDKSSKFKTSGQDIETLRRKGQETRSTALKEDNSMYKISTILGDESITSFITIVGNIIFINPVVAPVFFKSNTFTITGSNQNNGTYTYNDANVTSLGGSSYSVLINETFAADTTNEEFTITTSFLKAKQTEGYDTVNGLIDNTTPYNLDYAIPYVYLRHSNRLNASQSNSLSTDLVINNDYDRNGELQVQKTGDVLYTANQDFTIGQGLTKLHDNKIYELNVNLKDSEVNLLINSYKGNGTTPYGYISFDYKNSTIQGFLLSLRGIPEIMTYDLILLGK